MGDRLKLHVPDVAEKWIEHSYPWRSEPERPQRYEDGVPLLLPGRTMPRIWLPSGHIVPALVSGGAMLFDDSVASNLKVNSTPVTAAPFTMAAWIRTDATGITQSALTIGSGTLEYWTIRLGSAANAAELSATSAAAGINVATSAATLGTGTWGHICGVEVSSSSRAIFLNGAGKATNAGSVTPSANSITIGKRASATAYFSGDIAECAIWNVALSDAEVALIGQAGGLSPLLMHPEKLVFYAPLIGRYSSEIDIKGGLSLTGFGATASAHPRVFYPSAGRSRVVAAAGAAAVGGPLVGGKLAGGFLAGEKLAH